MISFRIFRISWNRKRIVKTGIQVFLFHFTALIFFFRRQLYSRSVYYLWYGTVPTRNDCASRLFSGNKNIECNTEESKLVFRPYGFIHGGSNMTGEIMRMHKQSRDSTLLMDRNSLPKFWHFEWVRQTCDCKHVLFNYGHHQRVWYGGWRCILPPIVVSW